jgi:hypothetical protein
MKRVGPIPWSRVCLGVLVFAIMLAATLMSLLQPTGGSPCSCDTPPAPSLRNTPSG